MELAGGEVVGPELGAVVEAEDGGAAEDDAAAAGDFADDGNFSGGGVEREKVMRGEADDARAAGQRDGVDDGLAGDALAEVPRGLRFHPPFLNPILN